MGEESRAEETRPAAQAEGFITSTARTDAAALAQAEAAVSADWQTGDIVLDLYEVRGVLGEGGMGKVYRVHHTGWNVDLAVKSPRKEMLTRAGGAEDFVREAETWVNLGLHPNAVSCYYVRTLGGIPRVFAEYVEGGSLSDWVKDRRLYTGGRKEALERILDVAIQFAWGLNYAHEQGLIHQDVKPANVMMTADGVVKVTDFGLAKARTVAGESGPKPPGLSVMASYAGRTEAYCSPEQAEIAALAQAGVPAERRPKLTRKTDIWSWGVSVLEMFFGKLPCPYGQAAREVFESFLETGAGVGEIPGMPAEVAALLRGCFEKEPAGRPATMAEVAGILQQAYEREAGAVYPREAPEPAEALADSLNNRALSCLDLGREADARAAWDRALAFDPQHPETVFNRGVLLWRQGQLTDDVFLRELDIVRSTHSGDPRVRHMQALVHVERADPDSAISLLEAALGEMPADTEIISSLQFMRSGDLPRAALLRILEGHTRDITCVVLVRSGRWALSGSRDCSLRLWDCETGRCLRIFDGHSSDVTAVCISADLRIALSASWDSTLRLWEVASGRCLHVLQGPRDLGNYRSSIMSASLTLDGRWAVSGGGDEVLRVWDTANGLCVRTAATGHVGGVQALCITRDGRHAVSGGGDGCVKVWELATGRCAANLEGHTDSVRAVSSALNDRFILSGADDRTIRLWDASTGKCFRVLEGHTDSVRCLAFSPEGCHALSGSRDGTIRLWETHTGRCLRTLSHHANALCFSGDGRQTAFGSGKTLHLWQLPTETVKVCAPVVSRPPTLEEVTRRARAAKTLLDAAIRALDEARPSAALAMLKQVRDQQGHERTRETRDAWSRLSLLCPRVGLRGVWHVRDFQGHSGAIRAISLTQSASLLLTASADCVLRLWEMNTGRCLHVFEAHRLPISEDRTGQHSTIHSAYLSSDGRLAASTGSDRTLVLWDMNAVKRLTVWPRLDSRALCLSTDSRWILSGASDGVLRLYHVPSGTCVRSLVGHTRMVTSVSLSPSAQFALSSSWDKTLRLWDVTRGTCLAVMSGHGRWVASACLGSDCSIAVSAGGEGMAPDPPDNTVRLWKLPDGRLLNTFSAHTGWVNSVVLTQDRGWALSAGADRTVRVWQLESQQCVRTLETQGEVTSLCLSRDARFAISGSADGTVSLWELDWELAPATERVWDEGAVPFLKQFLARHTPYAAELSADSPPSEREIRLALTRHGAPRWTDDDFLALLHELRLVGYGSFEAERVRHELAALAHRKAQAIQ